MSALIYLIPVTPVLVALGRPAFLRALRSGQLDHLHGAADRILFDGD